jgi:molybdopterin molybdotransferase
MGADAVVMVEHTQRDGDMIGIQRAPEPGENIAPRGSDAHAGTVVLRQGARIDYSAIAVLASIGCTQPPVARRPRVAVLSTGDEVVDASATPGDVQIRNSNSYALAALAERAGAEVIQLPIAPDEPERLNQLLTQGLSCGDVLLVSGGVSAGKFDLVEPVLGRLGAQFLFDAVRIRPGRPAVFGIADNHFVFGLPGNPLGTIVTFELLVRPALELLCGADPSYLGRPYICGELGFSYHGKALPLTQFVPVRLSGDFARARVEKLPYHGSADLPALAAADGWLVVPEYRTELHQSAVVDVLLK